MIETKEKEIDGATYSVTQMTARRALRTQAKLVKLLGPSATELFSGMLKTSSTEAEKALAPAVLLFVNQLDEKTFDSFILEMLQGVRRDGVELKAETVDMYFAGKLNSLYLLLQFVLEVNYADFFQEGGIMKLLFSAVQKPAVQQVPESTNA